MRAFFVAAFQISRLADLGSKFGIMNPTSQMLRAATSLGLCLCWQIPDMYHLNHLIEVNRKQIIEKCTENFARNYLFFFNIETLRKEAN